MNKYITFCIVFFSFISVSGKEYFVSKKGTDLNPGTITSPFSTINAAAQIALPGDTITVREGVYREWVNPVRGGESNTKRIVYRAAQGEKVSIKGSEVVTGWKKISKNVWSVKLPDSFFGSYHSLKECIQGDWFYDQGRKHHTGEIFLNGQSLYEVDSLEKVMNPKPFPLAIYKERSIYTWYVESTDNHVTVYANFQDFNPNKELIEVSVRPTCFYPTLEGLNYITISGFEFCQAASQWGPPTAGQVGMVATNWNKGWIIENNLIHDSRCSGVTLGKEHGTGHNLWTANPEKHGTLHQIGMIFKVLNKHWDKDFIGSHIVRNNTIYNCEQTGISGSFGCVFSEISGNHIYDIWIKRQFKGDEIAGIKFHAAIDTKISNNWIHQTAKGIWLDWQTQGTRISGNVFYDNDQQDLFLEVNHGPYLVDNNISLSIKGVQFQSHGGAFVHNLFAGEVSIWGDPNRYTPYHYAHSTKIKGFSIIETGDDRFFNNIFIPIHNLLKPYCSTRGCNYSKHPCLVDGNVFYNKQTPSKYDTNASLCADTAIIKRTSIGEELFLDFSLPAYPANHKMKQITTEVLGRTMISEEYYENPDGSSLIVDTDYFGNKRDQSTNAGPFHILKNGNIRIWSKAGVNSSNK